MSVDLWELYGDLAAADARLRAELERSKSTPRSNRLHAIEALLNGHPYGSAPTVRMFQIIDSVRRAAERSDEADAPPPWTTPAVTP